MKSNEFKARSPTLGLHLFMLSIAKNFKKSGGFSHL